MKKNLKKIIVCTTLSTLILTNSVYGYSKKDVSVNIDNMLGFLFYTNQIHILNRSIFEAFSQTSLLHNNDFFLG